VPLGWSREETRTSGAQPAPSASPRGFDAAAEALGRPLVLREAAALTRALGGGPAPLARQEDARPWPA
ncbi:MAG TPA: hypothetical protein VEY31_03390, partial [Roseococcus sp.]|nr:hypothetical protein [Roseococcus sp.]